MTTAELCALQQKKLELILEIKDIILEGNDVKTILQGLCQFTRKNVTPRPRSRFAKKSFFINKAENFRIELLLRLGENFTIQINNSRILEFRSPRYFELYQNGRDETSFDLNSDRESLLLLKIFGNELEKKLCGLEIDESRIIKR